MGQQTNDQYVFKIALLGAAGAGKTSLINQFVEKKFEKDYKPTLGSSIIAKDIVHEHTDVRLVIWDIAGQEKYNNVRAMYLNGSIGCILVYDVTRKPTFTEIQRKWIKDFQQYAMEDAAFTIIGNKIDLVNKRKVSTKEGEELAHALGSNNFIETSALTGENVEMAFKSLVSDVLKIARQ